MVRHSIPKRCDKPAAWYSPANGYRCCAEHLDETVPMTHAGEVGPDGCRGPCDYPMDGLGAARYERAQ